MKKFVCIVLVLICSGCWEYTRVGAGMQAASNRDKLNKLEVGMSKEQLTAIMGKPNMREAQSDIEWWLYRTGISSDNQPNMMTANLSTAGVGWDDQQFTPVAVQGGQVIGWGRNFYEERAKNYNINITNK